MLVDIVNKILMVLFFMSCLNIFRHAYYFIQSLISSSEETPVKYRITNLSLLILSVSIGYVLSTLFLGIKL